MLIAVVGATATGKTGAAVALAEYLGGPEAVELIGADAMALYRGMDIGTAKPPLDERRGFTHHGIDLLEVGEEASVAAYQEYVAELVGEIGGRGRRSLLVGGSGLYVRAALDRFDFPPRDPRVRERLEGELKRSGPQALHERLAAVDAEAAQRIEPRNGRRIVRALEVIELTGQPFAASLPSHEYARPTVQFGLTLPRDLHDDLIARRTRQMFAQGFVDEVAALADKGLAESKTAAKATGYQQVLRLLAGFSTPEQAEEDTIVATRQLARKQDKWFRRDPRIVWLDATGGTESVVEAAAAHLRSLGD